MNSDMEQDEANAANEELKQLKDFKAIISEKTVPKSIKHLRRSMCILPVLLLIIISVDLSYKFVESSEFEEAIYAVLKAY
mmetsp:Transcript_40636/g.36082  ORF Transcript_40636/g.36082 Transcript_40636/m.36082 type:complete len:80 (+) Transcript_40636:2418-2657(+)